MDIQSAPAFSRGIPSYFSYQRKVPQNYSLQPGRPKVPSNSSYSSVIYSEPYQHLHRANESAFPRGFSRQNPPSSSLFDDDPGIMSEAETSSTGFRRGGKCRSSLPVVRTPSKTLERPLGLVFLQYRSETKRALLPNEITSLDTVKALFVRSFPRQLTMEYVDVMHAKIYIHDGSKDMFYELEDLRDIRDRSVLRLFEPNINGNGAVPSWDQDQSYFSEPEFDSDYQHQHIHKTKGSKTTYMNYSYPVGATLPRGGPPILRPYSPAVALLKPGTSAPPPKPQRQYSSMSLTKRPSTPGANPSPTPSSQNPLYSPRSQERSSSFPPSSTYTTISDPRLVREIYSSSGDPGYASSPERGRFVEDPYYAQFVPRSGSITPIIDEEARVRMEHMERQLANLTGLVQKALVVGPPGGPPQPPPPQTRLHSTLPRNIIGANSTLPNYVTHRDYIPTRDYRDDIDKHSSSSSASLQDDPVLIRPEMTKAPKFGKEKSVSFSDDPPEHGKQHSPTHHTVEKPTKPAIKSSTLPRMSQDRVLKTGPQTPTQVVMPKVIPNSTIVSIPSHPYERQFYATTRNDLGLSPEMFNQLRILQKKAKELKGDVRILRRSVQAQAHTVRETLRDTFLRFKVVAMAGNDQWMQGDPERAKIHKEGELYKQEMLKLDKDLTELETTVEELRGHVINKRTRVNMSDVENMALILSKSSKSVADLKARFPLLQDGVKGLLANEMDRLVVEERFMKEEPERLESALKRCKKLTGTLVTLKRLASVQEQRLPSQDSMRSSPQPGDTSSVVVNSVGMEAVPKNNRNTFPTITPGNYMAYGGSGGVNSNNPENALDALLDELADPMTSPSHTKTLIYPVNKDRLYPDPPKRLPSYPSTESGGSPVRNYSSWNQQVSTDQSTTGSPLKSRHPPLPPKPTKIPPPPPPRTSSKSPLISPSVESESSEGSMNSQDARQDAAHQAVLSQRHQELLRKQKQLQDQYTRLQLLQKVQIKHVEPNSVLKKTGSEGNLRVKLGLGFSSAPTGSLTNLNKQTNTLYETDIL